MKNHQVRWGLSQADIDRLSASLRPIRTIRETAAILGCSVSQVVHLENSALHKILSAVNNFDRNGNHKNELK